MRATWSGLGTLLALSLAGGCEHGHESGSAPAPATPTVTVTEVIARGLPRTSEHIGATEAVNSVTVRARVEGFLQDRLFTEGDLVAKGDLLYRIDPSVLEADLRVAQSDLATNQAAQDKALAEIKRYERLLAKGDVSREAYDTVLAAEKEARARAASSTAAKDRAQLNLEYASIQAPIAGRIGATRVNIGNLVGPNENSQLATIVQIDPIYVIFRPGGAEIDAITARQRDAPVAVSVTLPHADGPSHQGRIDFIDNRVDPATGTLKMRALIPNPDGTLLPGRFARVTVDLGEQPDALLVPQKALVQNQGGFLAYVVGSDGRVQERKVSVGETAGPLRVVLSGLKAGERVVVEGVQLVSDGTLVKSRPAEPPRVRASGETPDASGKGAAADPAS